MIVSLVGLAVMWCGCLIIFTVLGLDQRTGFFRTVLNDPLWMSLLFWILHTVYVLCCGHYTSWRCDNPLTSLLLMLPIAAIPYVLAVIVQYARIAIYGGYRTDSATMGTALILTVPAILIVGWLSYAAMRRKLNPAVAPILDTDANSLTVGAWRPPSASMPVAQPFRLPVVTLLWQSIWQNPRIVVALSLMFFAGSIAFPLSGSEYLMKRAASLLIAMTVAGFVGVSWLGVLVFAGDGAHNRMKFLADRGVSPTAIWLGRHWIGLTVCAIGLLLFTFTQFQIFHSDWWQWIRSQRMASPSLLMIALMVVGVYATSQWVSQTLRIIAGTAFLAPLLSGFMIGWLVSLPDMWGANATIVGVCLALPFLVTWLAMKDHADGRRGGRFWLIHAIGLFLIFALPICHTLVLMTRLPSLSRERRAELISLASKYPEPTYPRTLTLVERVNLEDSLPYYSFRNTLVSGEQVEEVLSNNGDFPNDWLQYNPMGRWIKASTMAARRLRLSYLISDQDFADDIEIYLTRTFSHPSMKPWLAEAFSQEAIALVSDFDARVEARRRAVLLSWRKTQQKNEDKRFRNPIGGYDYDGDWIPTTTPKVLLPVARSRYRDAIIDQIMALLEAGRSQQSTRPYREQLHRRIFGEVFPFDEGPYADQLQATADPAAALYIDAHTPAQQWFAPWEENARRLLVLTKEINDE